MLARNELGGRVLGGGRSRARGRRCLLGPWLACFGELLQRARVGGTSGRCVALADGAGEAVGDGCDDRLDRDRAGQRGEAAEQGRVRHRSADVLLGQLGGRHRQHRAGPELVGELADAELGCRAP